MRSADDSSEDSDKPQTAHAPLKSPVAESPTMRQSRTRRASVTRKNFMERNSLAARWGTTALNESGGSSDPNPAAQARGSPPSFTPMGQLLPNLASTFREPDGELAGRGESSRPGFSDSSDSEDARTVSPRLAAWAVGTSERQSRINQRSSSRRQSLGGGNSFHRVHSGEGGMRMSVRMSRRIRAITADVQSSGPSNGSAAFKMMQDEYRGCEKSLYLQQRTISILAIVSLLLGVAINELCAAGDYRNTMPPLEELLELEDTDRADRECLSPLELPLKIASSSLGISLVGLATIRFRTESRAEYLRTAVKSHSVASEKQVKGLLDSLNNARVRSCWHYLFFVIQAVMLAVHSPPFLVVDFTVQSMGMQTFYRLESVACALMLPRIIEVTWV
jgi:hypothetical protein